MSFDCCDGERDCGCICHSPLLSPEPRWTEGELIAAGWLPPDEAARLKADRHEFDEDSVLDPVTGKPYPLRWGEDNWPDPLCCCGALWLEDGCESLGEQLRRLKAEIDTGWLPPDKAAKLRAAVTRTIDDLTAEWSDLVSDLKAKLAAQQPVIDAARAWVQAHARGGKARHLGCEDETALIAAVDALDADAPEEGTQPA